ncbi:MAG TPA: hypothetical protein PLX08_00835 [Bacteroidales bacterium]|nr:hypothetical protein [Bacteroidales bacterium]
MNLYSDDQIYQATGIKNWSAKNESYCKILNSNKVLVHDEAGIYFVDQLAITYTSNYQHLFFIKPELFTDSDFPQRFVINKKLTLVLHRGKEHQYHKLYTVEYLGKQFAELFIHKTSNTELSRLQIDNKVLYTESLLKIINFIAEVATILQLKFLNYCNYDVAMDSLINFYKEISLIYYKSDFCSSYVHEAYNSEAIYTFYGKRRKCKNEVDPENNSIGTITFGSPNSATGVRIYPKTPECIKKGKNYIKEIHEGYFGNNKTIYRVEAFVRSEFFNDSKPFGIRGYDLMDLLLPLRLRDNFYLMLGDKVKFRKIKPKRWTENRNPDWDIIEFLSPPQSLSITNTSLLKNQDCKSVVAEIDEVKTLAYRYLEGKLPFQAISSYLLSCSNTNMNLLLTTLNEGIAKAMRNYKKPVNDKRRCKIKKLYALSHLRFKHKYSFRMRLYFLLLF